MRKNYKKILLVGIMTIGILTSTGCGKVKELIPGKKSEKASATQTMERPTTLGHYQDMVSQRTAIILAQKYGIDISQEAIQEFITNVVGDDLISPTELIDINNNPEVIKAIIGDAGYIKSFIPPYVEEKLAEILEEEHSDIGEEELTAAVEEYSDYLDSLGVKDEARRDYVQHILSLENMTMQMDQEFYVAYAEAAVELMEIFTPEYLESLNLQ